MDPNQFRLDRRDPKELTSELLAFETQQELRSVEELAQKHAAEVETVYAGIAELIARNVEDGDCYSVEYVCDELWTKSKIFEVLHVVRSQLKEKGYSVDHHVPTAFHNEHHRLIVYLL
jgi:hypothetical protein